MEQENRIRTLIRQAIDPVAPPAPWLPDQIVAAVREEARSGRRRGGAKAVAAIQRRQIVSIMAGGLAVLAVLAVVAALLLGSRVALRSHSVPASTRTPDPTVAAYQAIIDRDMGTSWNFGLCTDAAQPDVCRSANEHEQMTLQRLNADLAAAKVPAVFSQSHAEIRRSVVEILADLAAGQSAIDAGDQSKALQARDAILHTDTAVLRPAVARVHCYPRGVGEFDDTTGRYPCTR